MAVAEEQQELQISDIQGTGLTVEEFWIEIEKGNIQPNMTGLYNEWLEEYSTRYYLYSKSGSMFHVMALRVDGEAGQRWRLLDRNWNGSDVREGTISEELFIDLRNKNYYFKRNGKELKFRISNLDQFIPRGTSDRTNETDWGKFQIMIEDEENTGMYGKLSRTLSTMGEEVSDNNGRMIQRLVTRFSYLELLAKMDVDITKMDKDTIMLLENKAIDAQMEDKTLNPATLLGVSKRKAKFFRRMDFAWAHGNLKRLQEITDDEMKEMDEIYDLLMMLDDKYGVDRGAETWRRTQNLIFHNRTSGNNIFNFCQEIVEDQRFPHTNVKRLFEYIAYELPLTQGLEPDSYGPMQLFKDYLRMSYDMGVQNIDKYPDSLKKAHDVISANYKVALNEEKERLFMAQVDKMNELNYAGRYKKLEIVVPEGPKDLIQEGSVLGHCVSSYVNNVAKGKCHIVFLREAKEDPHVTVEIRDGRITQARGKFNRPATPAEQDSLAYFAKKHELQY